MPMAHHQPPNVTAETRSSGQDGNTHGSPGPPFPAPCLEGLSGCGLSKAPERKRPHQPWGRAECPGTAWWHKRAPTCPLGLERRTLRLPVWGTPGCWPLPPAPSLGGKRLKPTPHAQAKGGRLELLPPCAICRELGHLCSLPCQLLSQALNHHGVTALITGKGCFFLPAPCPPNSVFSSHRG